MGMVSRAGNLVLVVTLVAAPGVLPGCGGSSSLDDEAPGLVEDAFGDKEIVENFLDTVNMDAAATDAGWSTLQLGWLRGPAVTSRTAYVYSYPETNNGVNSGLGQYAAFLEPLTGTDLTVMSPPMPPVSQGRRVQWTISDTLLGAKGTITGVAWGPDRNQTVAATYPNVKLRMGYQATNSLSLSPPFSTSYQGAPTLLYNGPYTVSANANVGNTPGHPLTPHVGGYPEGFGCTGAAGAPGGHNAALFAYTGWFAWPTPTTNFAWDPGDPLVANDRVLVFDASVQAGNFTQRLRGWFAFTYPCSGILIGGRPKSRMITTYEGDQPDPQDNFMAGIVNPEPSATDMRFTFTRLRSTAQSVFLAGAYGDDTDYGDPTLVPATQSGGAQLVLEFQGADAVATDGVTIDTSKPFTDWVSDIDDCDGMQYIRFRATLIAHPTSLSVAKLDSITIPMEDLNP